MKMKPTSRHWQHCLDALNVSPFFAVLDLPVKQEILELFTYEKASKRDTRISEGGNQAFYLVVSGRAKVSVYHPETGREHILSLLGQGDCYDIIPLLDGEPREAVLMALDDIEYLTTPLSTARKWLFDHPEFNKVFLPYLGEQMSKMAAQVEDLALYDTESRLAHLILRHITSNTPVHGLNLINDLSQETLAAMIGSVRVVVGRNFQKWKEEGILHDGKGPWSVHNLQALIGKTGRDIEI